jgi:hypothetical protein
MFDDFDTQIQSDELAWKYEIVETEVKAFNFEEEKEKWLSEIEPF